MAKRYRIVADWHYSGCIPIRVYVVQKCVRFLPWEKWENIKGFEDYRKAEALLKILEGK